MFHSADRDELEYDFDECEPFGFDPEWDDDDERDRFADYGCDDDGQPSTYDEYQDLYGGDDWDHGQYDLGSGDY